MVAENATTTTGPERYHNVVGGSDEDDDNDRNDEYDDEEWGSSLIIPITSSSTKSSNSAQFIEIFPEEMKETSVQTLIKVLQDEKADKNVWADAAVLYMQKKQPRDSLILLQKACEVMEGEDISKDQTDGPVRILAATGIAHLAVEQAGGAGASNNTKQRQNEKDEIRQAADQKFTQAGKADTFYPMTWIGRGMLNLSMEQKERRDQAKFFFQTTLNQCGPVLPALLGMGAVLYNEGDYKGAQEKYADAIRRYPTKSGAATRVGFGLACYKLGQVDRAKASFARALDIDPENVQAMVGAAILEMAALDETQKDFSSRTEKAIKMMSMANLLDHSNAMVQNHLANHYFWKWTPITGTVVVTQGSNLIKSSTIIPVEPGEPIRIGAKFEATVKEDVDNNNTNTNNPDADGYYVYPISLPWKDESTSGLKIWKKDYERVIDLAKGAYSSTAVQEIQAESLFFLARVYHVREDNDNAFKFYDRACKLAPTLHPARYGLAQTLIVKEDYVEAAKQLQQLLTSLGSTTSGTSANATDALALLGLLEVRSGTKTQEEGITHIRKAIDLDPVNPELILLEAMALQQHKTGYVKALERYKKAVELMKQKAANSTSSTSAADPVPYNVYNNIGVLCHETKRYDEAYEMFYQALSVLDDDIKTVSTAVLTNRGIDGGRIRHPDNTIFFGYVDTKISCTIIVPTTNDNNNENEMEVDNDNKEKKSKTIQLVFSQSDDENVPTDIESLPFVVNDDIRIGETTVTVIEKIEKRDEDGIIFIIELRDEIDIPPEPENDENNAETKTTTPESYPLYVKRENQYLEIKEATTIAFNIARLHETTGRTLAAIEIHKAITKRNPAYVNSYLRLACIAVDCGCLNECAEWLKIAAVSAPGNSEVLTLIGNLHLSLCDWKPAQKVFDGLMAQKIASVEAYSSLSMGNIYFATLHVKEDRYAKHLQYAADFYKRILTKDPLNAYAANGIGTVLAEKAEIFKAKEIFNRVREVSGDTIADSLLNLGHIYLAQKKHPEALQMYQNYLKRAEDGTTPITSKSRLEDIVDVLLYIAFAYFDWARHTELFNDANAAPADGRYKQAMEHIRLAISKRSKKEVILKYNLCMTKLQAANCVLQKLTRNIPRTVEEVEEALHGLEESLKTVEKMLEDKEKGVKINIKTSVLEDFLKHCRANIASAQSHLEDEKKRAEEERAEMEFRRLAAEAAMKEAALKEAIKKQEELKKQEERDRRAEAKMRKVEELKAGWTQEQVAQEEKEKKAAKKRGRDADTQDFIVDDEDDNNNNNNSGSGRKPPRQGGGLFDDSEDSDSGGEEKSSSKKNKTKPSRNDLFGDSDDDDDDNNNKKDSKPTKKAAADKPKKKTVSKGLFGDSDDDDDVEFDAPAKDSNNNKATTKPASTSKDLFGDSDDDDESDEDLVKNNKDNNKESGDAAATTAKNDQPSTEKKATTSSKDLFGDSDDDDESDEELVASGDKKKRTSDTQEEPTKKKQKIVDEDDDD